MSDFKKFLSNRLPEDLTESSFFSALERLKKKHSNFLDLTVSSPLRLGITPDLKRAADESAAEWGIWNPEAAGNYAARLAVADYYAARGANLENITTGTIFSPEEIFLTSSTSEAYSILFKTFCNPGDVVLTPIPGYPLLDTLSALEKLKTYPYFLKRQNAEFVIDCDSLLSAPENAKILLLVSPHNPTGHTVSEQEWNFILQFCAERNLVLLVDEVFGDYVFDNSVKRSWLYDSFENISVPIFWLNGLSKTVGSPELKLGWMASRNISKEIRQALEYVADAYLSVSSVAQALAKPLLRDSLAYENHVSEILQQNLKTLRSAFHESICPKSRGGWYASLHLGEDDEKITYVLLDKCGVLVQPGFFFDFEEDGWIVISLLQRPEVFAEGIRRLKAFYDTAKK